MKLKIKHGLKIGALSVAGLFVIYYVGKLIKAKEAANAAAISASADSLDNLGVTLSGTTASSSTVTGNTSTITPLASSAGGVTYTANGTAVATQASQPAGSSASTGLGSAAIAYLTGNGGNSGSINILPPTVLGNGNGVSYSNGTNGNSSPCLDMTSSGSCGPISVIGSIT